MGLLNYIESIDSVVDNAEIESLYMLLEYYNKELTMSVYMESGEVQQANPQQQNPSIFEKIWNGIKRLFEIVKNAFKKFFDLFKKKPFKVNTVPDNEKQNLVETFKNAAAGGEGSNISEAAFIKSAASPIVNGIQTASRISSATGNTGKGVAVGAGVGALNAAGAGIKAVTTAIGFPIGMLAGFAIGTAFNICAQVLETTIVKSIKTLLQPAIVKKSGDELYNQSESFYSIMNNMKLDTDVNVLAKPVYDYIKHDKFDHTGENCIIIMNNWMTKVNNDPILSGKSQANNQTTLNPEQLQLLTDATTYIEMLNEQNGDTEVIQLLSRLNTSFDKTNQYIQSPNCVVNKIPVDKIKQLVSNILTKNAKNCLTFINCMNSIKNLGVGMWNNINGANQYVNGNGVNQNA